MDKIGTIEIRIKGTKGNFNLTPENYDIKEIISLLENVENLLFPNNKRNRPTITYNIEHGSVKHSLKTSIQYIIGFNAIIAQINNVQNIDFLDIGTAKALEHFQDIAKKKNYEFNISTSIEDSNHLQLDKSTNFYRTESIWADAEFYFYGKVTNAGGKDKANIHIFSEELGTVKIQTPISFLETYDENMLYKTMGIRAIGKQNSETGEIDTKSLKFAEIIDYLPIYDEKYLKSLRDKAKQSWIKNINPDTWLKEIRGSYEL